MNSIVGTTMTRIYSSGGIAETWDNRKYKSVNCSHCALTFMVPIISMSLFINYHTLSYQKLVCGWDILKQYKLFNRLFCRLPRACSMWLYSIKHARQSTWSIVYTMVISIGLHCPKTQQTCANRPASCNFTRRKVKIVNSQIFPLFNSPESK